MVVDLYLRDYAPDYKPPVQERPKDVTELGYKDDDDYDRMQKWIKEKQEEHRKWIEERKQYE